MLRAVKSDLLLGFGRQVRVFRHFVVEEAHSLALSFRFLNRIEQGNLLFLGQPRLEIDLFIRGISDLVVKLLLIEVVTKRALHWNSPAQEPNKELLEEKLAPDLLCLSALRGLDVEQQQRVDMLANGLLFKGQDHQGIEVPPLLILQVEGLNPWQYS